MKKTVRVMLAAILALTLSLGIAPAAYAAPDPLTINQAAITKVLKVPVGTAYPAMTFDFMVERVGYNDTTAIPANMPVIGSVSIAFDGANAPSPAENFEGSALGVDTYYLESAELLGAINWPNAGKYEYSVIETTTNYVISDPLHEALELSLAEYLLSIYVREYTAADAAAGNIPAGKQVGDRYIYAVGMIRVTTDEGTPGGYKGDPTPGGDQIDYFYSEMIFTNKYVKTNGADDPDDPDPTDPGDSTLNVTKTVTGDLGSLVLPFNFALSLNVPTLIPGYVLSYYKAYLVGTGGVLDPTGTVLSSLIGTDPSGAKYVMFAPGATVDFQLAHDQKLVFINTPVGTSYTVSEDAEAGYTTSYRVTTNNIQGGVVSGYTITGALVGEALNRADYTNNYDLTPPAGLSMDNLPFYSLVLLALGALIAFVVVRRRKRQKEN